MPRTGADFNNYVAQELRRGDIRMDEIVKTVAAIEAEQAHAKELLARNTETINQIKKDTADMLAVFDSWRGAMRVLEMIGRLAFGAWVESARQWGRDAMEQGRFAAG